jgi:hypothetical protein
MGENFEHRSFLVVDVASFGARDDRFQLQIRRGLARLLDQAFEDAGLVLDDCDVEDRGDGKIVLIPSTVTKMRLVDPLLARIAVQVRQHNDMSSESGRIRLRLALHAGEVARDDNGWSGTELNTACRLVNSGPLREVVAEHADAPLVVVVSDLIYSNVVRHGHGAVRPEEYRRIEIREKELADVAWVHVPGRGGQQVPERPFEAGARSAVSGHTIDNRSGGVNFLGGATVHGDVVGRDKRIGSA